MNHFTEFDWDHWKEHYSKGLQSLLDCWLSEAAITVTDEEQQLLAKRIKSFTDLVLRRHHQKEQLERLLLSQKVTVGLVDASSTIVQSAKKLYEEMNAKLERNTIEIDHLDAVSKEIKALSEEKHELESQSNNLRKQSQKIATLLEEV